MFACESRRVVPDIMCLSKGLTGGFLPMAATVCTARVHESFCGTDRSRTFFHGHSYTANPLGCAAGIASLKIFDSEPVFERIAAIEKIHSERTRALKEHPAVADVRIIGTVMALELKADDPGYFSEIKSEALRFLFAQGRFAAAARKCRVRSSALRNHARRIALRLRRDRRIARLGSAAWQVIEDSLRCHSEERSDEEPAVSLALSKKQIPRVARDDRCSCFTQQLARVCELRIACPRPN